MEHSKEEEAVFITPRAVEPKPPLNLPVYPSSRTHADKRDLPTLPLGQGQANQQNSPLKEDSVSSRITTSFAHFGLSPRDSSRPIPPIPLKTSSFYQHESPSPRSAITDEPSMDIFSTADFLHLPNLPKEASNRRLSSAEGEQMVDTSIFDSWEHARRYVATSHKQLQKVVAEVRRLIDPRIPSYLLIVASLVFRGLAYVAGIKAPLLIKSFVSDQLRLAVTMGELDGTEVDEYLRHHGTPTTNSLVDMFAYHTVRSAYAKTNNANPQQEKNHTTATKVVRPKTISEYLSSHALLDWFVEVDAYLEFLDMTAIDQVNVVTSLFRGIIRKWWNHLKAPQKDAIITWLLIRKLMTSEFLPADYISDFYDELRTIRQTTTVKEYNQKYYAFIQDIPDLSPEIAYYHYVAGLKPCIHTFVKVLPSSTLQQAMRHAETFDEAFTKGAPLDGFSHKRNQQSQNFNPRGASYKRQMTTSFRGNFTRPASSTERRSQAEVKCFNYGKKGHYSNRCSQPRKEPAKASVQRMNSSPNKKKEDLKGVPPQ